jgi:hypothetical protein
MFAGKTNDDRQVSTACGSGRVFDAQETRPLPQAVLTCFHPSRPLLHVEARALRGGSPGDAVCDCDL